MSRLREKQLEAGLTLQYIQRYKTNHKAAALRFEGFLGTVQKYEELLDEYAVEDNANENAAGIVHWDRIQWSSSHESRTTLGWYSMCLSDV